MRAEHCDQASPAACRARCGSGPRTLSGPAVLAIGVDAGEQAAAEARGSSDELSACALDAGAALVLCRSRHGTRQSPTRQSPTRQSARCLDESDPITFFISVGRRVAAA